MTWRNAFLRFAPLAISFATASLATVAQVAPSTTAALAAPESAKWKYFRTGNSADSVVKPRPGFALMGGGAQQDAAFHFLCERTDGGDFLILRADTDD